jgi:hypothetical protein
VVAYLALFFALGGTAIAAKPLITGADVQDGSLTGADVSDDSTLKGVDIDESDLGKVPSAQNADNAANADTLDGKDAAELGGGATTFDVAVSPPGAGDPDEQTVATLDNGVSILGSCPSNSTTLEGVKIKLDFTNPADGLTELQVSGVRLRDFDQPNTVLVQTSDPESGGLLQPEVPNFGSFHVIARVVRREEAQGPVVERGSWMRIDVAGTSRRITGSAQCNISGIVTPYG